MSQLAGKVAAVTGGFKGIDADMRQGLTSEGAAVVINDASSKEGSEMVVAEIIKAAAVQDDVAKESRLG